MKNQLNENIRSLRKSLGLTQEEFAGQLDIKRSLIGAYEEGRAEPRLNFCAKWQNWEIFQLKNFCIHLNQK